MIHKSEKRATTPEQIVNDIRRATRKHHSRKYPILKSRSFGRCRFKILSEQAAP